MHESPLPLGVTELASRAGLSPSRVHHYLVSLTRSGLLAQEPVSGLYGLGTFAVQLGLTAVDRMEMQHLSAGYLRELATLSGESAFFTVWSDQGPVTVRWEQGPRPLTVHGRLGMITPLLTSASGAIYLALHDPAAIEEVMQKELRKLPPRQRDQVEQAARARASDVLTTGVAIVEGSMQANVNAVAAPVRAASGRLIGALTLLGLAPDCTVSGDSAAARAVKRIATEFSARLGA